MFQKCIFFLLLSIIIPNQTECFHKGLLFKASRSFIKTREKASLSKKGTGGGFGKNSSNSTIKKTKKKQNDLTFAVSKQSDKQKQEETVVKLDRFGFKPPTEKDIFPDLDESLRKTIIGVNKKESEDFNTAEKITTCLMDYPLNLSSALFSSSSSNRSSSSSSSSSSGGGGGGNSQAGARKEEEKMNVSLLHQSPPVITIENFFTASECKEYQKMIQNPNQSLTYQVKSPTFSNQVQSISKRTSTTWFCSYSYVPTFLAKVQYIFSDISLTQMEEPQLVLYQKGQEFSWHYDTIPQSQCHNGGQRIATILVYLNDLSTNEKDGGATIFRDLKDINGNMLSIKPKQGMALIFFPSHGQDALPDDRTLHKGQVITTNKNKMICQMWLHQSDYKASVPSNNFVTDDVRFAIKEIQDKLL